ncbi:MAG: FtsX-like permease family protein [Luteitalea sp.]|nr:FtsX-like permease family protein [Luteitalea sp.]
MRGFLRKLSWLTQRRRKEVELREELEFHLDEETEQGKAAGLTEERARFVARRDLGNVTLISEDTRATWGWTMLEQLGQDLRYAVRMMASNRTFTALALLVLTLGIGANTAIYSFMDSILLRSLPVPDPERLVVLKWRTAQPSSAATAKSRMQSLSTTGSYLDPELGQIRSVFPYPAFELFQQESGAFSSVFAYRGAQGLKLTVRGQATLADGVYASGDYFRGTGAAAAAGRLLSAEDDRIGAAAVAVVSARFARQRFGDTHSAVGRSFHINDVPFTIVGVTPPAFFGVNPEWAPDFFVPLHANVLIEPRDQKGPSVVEKYSADDFYWLDVMGRLSPGVSREQAQAALGPLFREYVTSTTGEIPELMVMDGAGGLDSLRHLYSQPLYVLMTMVGLILAIACANIANLLLARSAARRREMAVRLSIGAGRLRVIRQLLTESVLLASIGGALGVLLAVGGMRVLTALLASGRENFTLRAELNWAVLGVTAALVIVTGLLFGLAPALQATRVDVIPALKEVRAGQVGGRVRRRWLPVSLSQTLVVAQIALSLLLLVGAGLFVRTLSTLHSTELGFNRENLLLLHVNAEQAGYRGPSLAVFYADLQRRFRGIPGVRDVSLSATSQVGEGSMYLEVTVPGPRTQGDDPTATGAAMLPVGPSYFRTLQIPIVLGREFGERDGPGTRGVVVVSESFARTHFGSESPLGRRMNVGPMSDLEIVGVVKDAHYGPLREGPAPWVSRTPPMVYLPYNQGEGLNQMVFALRTAGDPHGHVGAAREVLRQADAGVPMGRITTQAAQIDQTINQEIVFARLSSGFAMLALVIACVGLYGTMTYSVTRRTGEIGIRMALGAQRGRVMWLVLRQVIVLGLAGLVIGLPVALAASKLVESFLFETEPNDPLAITAAVGMLLAATAVAAYVPARRASRIDPMVALRHE